MEFIKALKTVVTKQRRRAGTRAYYASGEIHLSRLFGYKLIGDRYEPDPRFEPALSTIYLMLSRGSTLPEVKAALDAMKCKDSSNNRYSFARIISLVRPIYSGHIEQRGRLVEVKNMTPVVTLDIYRKAEKQLSIERKKLVQS